MLKLSYYNSKILPYIVNIVALLMKEANMGRMELG